MMAAIEKLVTLPDDDDDFSAVDDVTFGGGLGDGVALMTSLVGRRRNPGLAAGASLGRDGAEVRLGEIMIFFFFRKLFQEQFYFSTNSSLTGFLFLVVFVFFLVSRVSLFLKVDSDLKKSSFEEISSAELFLEVVASN